MKKLNTNDFIKKAKSVHGDLYDYSKVEYVNSKTKVCIICPYHGEFWQVPNNHNNLQGCPLCGKEKGIKSKTKTSTDFISESKKIHKNKFNYCKVDYKNDRTKVCIICPEHGEFWQTPNSHLRGNGCSICRYKNNSEKYKHTISDFIKKAKSVHGDLYDYSKVEYVNSNTAITIICPTHGEFNPTPNNHICKSSGCPKCVKKVSTNEIEIFDYISTLVYCECSNNSLISPYELDIYIPEKKIAIEFNGLYWHSELKGKSRNYHLNKTKLCNEKGIRLIHIFEDEWLYKKDIVKSRLKHILGLSNNIIFARKCEIREIDTNTKNKFLEKYHIQGKDVSSIRLGLFHNNKLLSVMTFGKNRFGKSNGYELIRYASIPDTNIVGGASKLLKFFERDYKPNKIKTYADLRWSEGNLYKKLGFKHIHNSSPNYFYIQSQIRYNRINFQKHKLKYILKAYDSNLSEWQNMQVNGWDRIWDCGNMVFEKY